MCMVECLILSNEWGNSLEMRTGIWNYSLRNGFLLNATWTAEPLNQTCLQRHKEEKREKRNLYQIYNLQLQVWGCIELAAAIEKSLDCFNTKACELHPKCISFQSMSECVFFPKRWYYSRWIICSAGRQFRINCSVLVAQCQSNLQNLTTKGLFKSGHESCVQLNATSVLFS